MDVNFSYTSAKYSYESYSLNVKTSTTQVEDGKDKGKEVTSGNNQPKDEVVLSGAAKKYKPDTQAVKAMLKEADNRTSDLKKLVSGLLSKQTEQWGKANAQFKNVTKFDQLNGKLGKFMASLEVDEATKAQAQKDIAEDGYWGVDATSTRILDFAKAISGGDPSKIETLRKACEKGFKQAESMWGGKLPQISQDTYKKVMDGFDEWEKSAAAGAAAQE